MLPKDPDPPFPPSALERFEEILPRPPTRPATFLDYDGTLAPIAPRPEEALLPEATREAVRRLARRCPVAIVSGRDLAELKALVRVPGLAYAGSHGFEVEPPEGPAALGPERDRFLPALDAAERDLRARTRGLPGVFVERKRFSVALHHRLAAPDGAALAAEAFSVVRASHPELRAIEGKRVFELLPAVAWDKGKAVLALTERFRRYGGDFAPLYLGDDATDEDAFRAVRDAGVGIAVLEAPRATAARYRLANVEEVRRFLERLAERLGA